MKANLLIILVSVLMTVTAVSQENLLLDGDFESGDFWSLSGGVETNPNMLIEFGNETSPPKYGEGKNLRVHWSNLDQPFDLYIYQKVTLTVGSTYEFSGAFRDAGSDPDSKEFWIQVIVIPVNGDEDMSDGPDWGTFGTASSILLNLSGWMLGTDSDPLGKDTTFTVLSNNYDGMFVPGIPNSYPNQGDTTIFTVPEIIETQINEEYGTMELGPAGTEIEFYFILYPGQWAADNAANDMDFTYDEFKLVDITVEPLEKPEVTIKKIPSVDAITIDGIADDTIWSLVEATDIDRDYVGQIPTLNTTTFKAVYGTEGIYVVVEVDDDVWMPSWLSGKADWQSDLIELYFDCTVPLDDGGGASGGNGNWQISINFSETGMGDMTTAGGVSSANTYDGNGKYTYEYLVTWDAILESDGGAIIDPAVRTSIGFDIVIVDLDSPDEASTRSRAWSNDATNGENWTQMDDVGLLHFSTETIPTGINQMEYHSNMVYPTIVANQFNIKADNIVRVTVFNTVGALKKIVNTNTNIIDVSDIPAGLYIVRVETSTETFTSKIIKR